MAFKKDEARDPHGRWTAIAGALHQAIDDIAKRNSGVEPAKAHRAVDAHFGTHMGKAKKLPPPVAKAVENGDTAAGLAHIAKAHRDSAVEMRKQGQDNIASRHRSLARALEAAAGKKQLTPAPKSQPNLKSLQLRADIKERKRKADQANRKITQQNLAMNRSERDPSKMTNGQLLLRLKRLQESPTSHFTAKQRQEHDQYLAKLKAEISKRGLGKEDPRTVSGAERERVRAAAARRRGQGIPTASPKETAARARGVPKFEKGKHYRVVPKPPTTGPYKGIAKKPFEGEYKGHNSLTGHSFWDGSNWHSAHPGEIASATEIKKKKGKK